MCTDSYFLFESKLNGFSNGGRISRVETACNICRSHVVEQGSIIPHLPGAEAFTHVAIKIDHQHIRFEEYHTLLGAICS